MAGRLAGQTINDRLLAAKHSIAGQGLAKSVCKATTEELIPPKKKHLEYLVQCTNEPNVSIPQLANLLIERSQNTNWVVVYKALITVHHIMCHGNERFTQYLASSTSSFQLSNFLDKSGVQGMLSIKTGYDMSPFIRRYSHYINEKALAYRTVAFDFCKKRSNDEGQLRTMHTDKLLKTLPVLQSQLDALLEFDCSANDLTNGVINKCFMYLFGDLIRLFAGYNSGIINLLEKYFDMNKKQCKEALDIYKKFLTRMDRVGEFLKVAENVGINKGEIPDLTKAPSSLLEALEQHLAYVEGKKTSASSTPSQNASNQKNLRSAVTALSSTSSSFGTVVANGKIDQHANGIDENLKLQILAEEEAVMNQFKTKLQYSPPTMSTANNPFFGNSTPATATSLPSQTHSSVDLLLDGGSRVNATSMSTAAAQGRPSDDLLQLNNPFADAFAQPPANTFATPQLPILQQPNNINAWMTNGNGYTTQAPPTNGAFVTESNFQSVFGNTEVKSASFDALGGVLQPMPLQGNNNVSNQNIQSNNNHEQQQEQPQQQTGSALLTGDLDSSLASLAKNLSINSRAVPVKEIQWNSPKNGSKTGSSWTPTPMSSTTGGAGYKPMNQSMAQTVQTPMFNTPMQPIMGIRPMVANNMIPPMGASQPPAAHLMGQQSLLFH